MESYTPSSENFDRIKSPSRVSIRRTEYRRASRVNCRLCSPMDSPSAFRHSGHAVAQVGVPGPSRREEGGRQRVRRTPSHAPLPREAHSARPQESAHRVAHRARELLPRCSCQARSLLSHISQMRTVFEAGLWGRLTLPHPRVGLLIAFKQLA